ncbi:kinesin-like protein KIF20A [Sinocyclocheilus grahami]|uniref:kinesin-like protein KIF20A n=1 Tax=Sinocyclocheilus grahami TaxID=75366 RepID=UPI0007AD295A|nr:PREDICTED: kinesin-like protein KIF20A [Sinocyclocheilus grahami]
MALASPCGLLSDEDECGAVLESTAADIGAVVRALPEISAISPAADPRTPTREITTDVSRRGSADDGSEKLKVFLRIRPLTEAEQERGEEQGCVNVQSEDNLLLRAPKDSHNMKSAERGVAQSLHKFTFTKIFGAQSSQQEVYDHTIREMVRDVLRGENRLLYTYGVTNSGKTYTIQGAGGEAGLLPRVLVSVFLKLSGRLYSAMDLKPVLSQEVRKLDTGEVRAEEMRRDAFLREVFLRIRPLTEAEQERGEEQGCVNVQSEDNLLLRAPKDSHNMKSAERGVAQSLHKFTFTKIFGAQSSQQEVYDHTIREMVRDVLRGENRLLYTYGVTNSGKTYTIQGAGGEAGLLPRGLVSVFLKLSGRLYSAMDLKPVLSQEVRKLDTGEVRAEEMRRDAFLRENLGECDPNPNVKLLLRVCVCPPDSDGVCLEANGLCLSGGEDLEEGVQFSVWVSFYEIYNEFLYDLLDAPPSLQSHKRATLRLSDDKHGNPYVKDLTWIQVRSAEEAWKVLKAGQRNQSFASTHLNHNSSRSHSIFTIRVLHVKPQAELGQVTRISELSVCDLAGSERCKAQQNGERMKEANNINTSLLTLGRCITALRHNQTNKSRPPLVVPFRDSKLTRVLQSFFCGHGRSCMLVNINPCASTYDETLQALKFSAIATQLVHGPCSKTRVAYILSLLREPPAHLNNTTLLEEESDEEGDITMFDPENCRISCGTCLLQNLKQLRLELQMLGVKLQSGERACCRNTDGERLRNALSSADGKLAKQDQMLVELHTSLQLVRADLRKKDELLAQLQHSQPPPPASGSCKKRGCGVAYVENQPPEKRPFFRSFFPSRQRPEAGTPYTRVLRSRQPSPPSTPIQLRVKY